MKAWSLNTAVATVVSRQRFAEEERTPASGGRPERNPALAFRSIGSAALKALLAALLFAAWAARAATSAPSLTVPPTRGFPGQTVSVPLFASFPTNAPRNVVALQADITRIATLMYAREGSSRAYPELGFADAHHPLTHHRNREELIEKVKKIECHHMEQFAHFVKNLKAAKDGDGTLLDHSIVVYGSSMSDPNRHMHEDVPCALLGRGDGALKPGRHVVYPETPQTNLWLVLAGADGCAGRKAWR